MGEVRAKKALGQHFLVDLNIARKICDSLSGGSAAGGPCTVLEVGCGMGVLTQFLLRRSDIVVSHTSTRTTRSSRRGSSRAISSG